MSRNFPQIASAQVVAQVGDERKLLVALPSGGIPTAVRVLHHGAADGINIDQKPLPKPGTTGVVLFPYGNSLNGVWLGSILTTEMDAATNDGDPYADYQSHWSGSYELLDGNGQWWKGFPDGTYLSFASTPGEPALTRHQVDGEQNRNTVPFAAGDRVPTAASPRPIRIHHATGTEIDITPTGSVSTTLAQGQTFTVTAGGSKILIDASGNMTFTLPGGSMFDIAGGGAASDSLALVSALVTFLNGHTHNKYRMDQVLTPAMISSKVVQVSR